METGGVRKVRETRLRGNEHFKRKEYEEALRCFSWILETYRSSDDSEVRTEMATTLSNRAITFIKLQRYTAALKDCEGCIASARLNGIDATKAMYRRALCLKHLGEFRDALEAFRSVRPKILKAPTARKCDTLIEELTAKVKSLSAKDRDCAVKTKVVKLDFSDSDACASVPENRRHPACVAAASSRKNFCLQSENLPSKSDPTIDSRVHKSDTNESQPTASVQRRSIDKLESQDKRRGLVKNDVRFVVDKEWWKQWVQYTGYADRECDHVGEEKTRCYPRSLIPGPISNHDIVHTRKGRLSAVIRKDKAFVVVSREMWTALHAWYGGGPALPRRVVERRDSKSDSTSLCVDIFDDDQKQSSTDDSKSETCEKRTSASTTMSTAFDCSACGRRGAENRCGRCKVVRYCQRSCQESHWPFHKERCRAFISGTIDRTDVLKSSRGKSGIVNVGNTCFLASIVQCLSHAVPLTRFLLGNRHLRDVNMDNPLGTRAVVTGEYVSLLKKLWLSHNKYHNPRSLHRSIVQRRDEFESLYSQQDANELLMFLLDAIHEDLNRVKKKPYLEPCEAKGRADDVVAKDFWQHYLKRNKSVVVDFLTGQYKSALTCPRCKTLSTTFDSFVCVKLPLPPVVRYKRCIVYVKAMKVRDKEGGALKMHSVRLPANSSISDLVDVVGEQSGIDPKHLFLTDVYRGYHYRSFKRRERITTIARDDFIVAHEFVPPSKGFMHIHLHTLTRSRGGEIRALGVPVIVSVPQGVTSFSEIMRTLWDSSYFGPLLGKTPRQLSSRTLRVFRTTSKGEAKGVAVEWLPSENSTASWQETFGDECNHVGIYIADTLIASNTFQETFRERCISTHPSATSASAASDETMERVTLAKCLDIFSEPETLDGSNKWRCPTCKDEVCATKQIQLWKVPQVLIVHLKRFDHRRGYGKKVSTPVTFPTECLDMTEYVLGHPENGETCVYDLFGVANHMGHMGYGHYIAYARDIVDTETEAGSGSRNERTCGPWWEFDDDIARPLRSSVVTRDAYMLFYLRRPPRTTVKLPLHREEE